jgi:hypothetical protein
MSVRDCLPENTYMLVHISLGPRMFEIVCNILDESLLCRLSGDSIAWRIGVEESFNAPDKIGISRIGI